jgi:hypothetical protein
VLYARPPAIEASIELALREDLTTLSQRAMLSNQRSVNFLPLECIVHLLRDARRRGDENTMNALMPPLLMRCEAILKKRIAETLPNPAEIRENILSDFTLLFVEDGTEGHSDELDYYECRFNLAFRSFRITHLRQELSRTQPLEHLAIQDDASPHATDEEFRLPRKVLTTPAAQFNNALRNEGLKAILNLPSDDQKAFILCRVLGYKEESEDPSVLTAAKVCGVTGRTIRNRLTRAEAKLSHFQEEL